MIGIFAFSLFGACMISKYVNSKGAAYKEEKKPLTKEQIITWFIIFIIMIVSCFCMYYALFSKINQSSVREKLEIQQKELRDNLADEF